MRRFPCIHMQSRQRRVVIGRVLAWPAAGAVLELLAAAALPSPGVAFSADIGKVPHLRIVNVGDPVNGHGPTAGVGDLNGDGLGDLALGTGSSRGEDLGGALVVLGSRSARRIDARQIGKGGFRIRGAPNRFPTSLAQAGGETAGDALAGVGDVNGDGLDDMAIGAPAAGNGLRLDSGSVYVVFGNRVPTDIDLAKLGSAGFRIDSTHAEDRLGVWLNALGDLNGDGLDDFLAAGPRRAAVVFGAPRAQPIDLRDPQGAALVLDPDSSHLIAGAAVAGDADGDGRADIAIALASEDLKRDLTALVEVRVLTARALAGAEPLSRPDPKAIVISAPPGRGLGTLAGISDFNGDGRGDLALSVRTVGDEGSNAARSGLYVVFGQAEARRLRLDRLGPLGVKLGSGPDFADRADQISLSAAGDANGDGLGDLAAGLPGADPGCQATGGTMQIFYGRRARPRELTRSVAGYRINGHAGGTGLGTSVAQAGDFDGDGVPDLAIDTDGLYDGSAGRRAVYVTAARPPPAGSADRRPGPPCFSLGVVYQDITTVLRQGELRVRVLSRRAMYTHLATEPLPGSRPRRVVVPTYTASIRLKANRPKVVRLRLTPAGRRLLRQRGSVDLRISSHGTGDPAPGREAKLDVALKRHR